MVNKNGFTKVGAGGAPYKMQPTDLFYVANTPQELMAKVKEASKAIDNTTKTGQ